MDEKTIFDEMIEQIISLLDEKNYIEARKMVLDNNEADIAEILEEIYEELGVYITVLVFRMLPKDISVEVFSRLPSEDQVNIIDAITEKETSYILDELDFDDKIDVLEELPANVVDKILENTPKEERKMINTYLNYPDDCAGTLMTPDYISLQKDMTVGEALEYIKKEGMDSETVYTCYVKSAGRKLIGIVSLRSLVITDNNTRISDIMAEEFVSINVYEDQEEVSDKFKKYGFIAIPVVDNEERLVGIITVDDILDVIEEETTEDMERMAGVMDDTTLEYLDMGVFKHVKNRIVWLFVLMASYVITGAIITSFESTLSTVIALVAYMPMLMGTGGNSGSQSATLIIRSLAVGDVVPKEWYKVLWKEFRIALIVGIILSIFNFARIYLIEDQGMGVALTVCASMIVIVIIAKATGGMLPLLAKKLKIDPALMASPMISSITDMVSVTTYFLLAKLILGI